MREALLLLASLLLLWGGARSRGRMREERRINEAGFRGLPGRTDTDIHTTPTGK